MKSNHRMILSDLGGVTGRCLVAAGKKKQQNASEEFKSWNLSDFLLSALPNIDLFSPLFFSDCSLFPLQSSDFPSPLIKPSRGGPVYHWAPSPASTSGRRAKTPVSLGAFSGGTDSGRETIRRAFISRRDVSPLSAPPHLGREAGRSHCLTWRADKSPDGNEPLRTHVFLLLSAVWLPGGGSTLLHASLCSAILLFFLFA